MKLWRWTFRVRRDREIDEEIDPLPKRGVRTCAALQQGRTGFGAGLDLVSVDGNDEIRSRREVAVDRARPDAGLGRDIAYRHLDAGRDKERGGGVEQRLLVAPGVGPLGLGRFP